MNTPIITLAASLLAVACTTTAFTPIETSEQLGAAQAEWSERYGSRWNPAEPNIVPPIPVRIIPPEERLYLSPEHIERRERLKGNHGELEPVIQLAFLTAGQTGTRGAYTDQRYGDSSPGRLQDQGGQEFGAGVTRPGEANKYGWSRRPKARSDSNSWNRSEPRKDGSFRADVKGDGHCLGCK